MTWPWLRYHPQLLLVGDAFTQRGPFSVSLSVLLFPLNIGEVGSSSLGWGKGEEMYNCLKIQLGLMVH